MPKSKCTFFTSPSENANSTDLTRSSTSMPLDETKDFSTSDHDANSDSDDSGIR
jgi:hypothetical protein